MKNYSVEKVDSDFYVREVQTDQYVYGFESPSMAREVCHHLNNGAAFAGWTPSFMLREGIFFIGNEIKPKKHNK